MKQLQYLKNVSTLQLDRSKCSGCMMCTIVCPHTVFAMEAKKAIIISIDDCMECGACMKNCPENAIFVQTGVGCAYGIILGTLKGTSPDCGCGEGKDTCC